MDAKGVADPRLYLDDGKKSRTADDFSAVPATDFQLLAVLRAAAADRPPAAAVAGRAVPTAHPLLAVPVATHIAPAPTARAAHHAGHAATDAAPAARGHVQSHTLRVRVEHRLHATESSVLHNERRSDGHALGCGLTRRETTVGGSGRATVTTTTPLPPTTGPRTSSTRLIQSHNNDHRAYRAEYKRPRT